MLLVFYKTVRDAISNSIKNGNAQKIQIEIAKKDQMLTVMVKDDGNGCDLLHILQYKQPDIILMDIRMPIMDGIEATAAVKGLYPDVNIIILTTFQEDEYIFGSLKNGADGYVMKDSGSDAIVSAIQAACTGGMLLDASISGKIVNAISGIDTSKKLNLHLNKLLTPRELDIVNQLMFRLMF